MCFIIYQMWNVKAIFGFWLKNSSRRKKQQQNKTETWHPFYPAQDIIFDGQSSYLATPKVKIKSRWDQLFHTKARLLEKGN